MVSTWKYDMRYGLSYQTILARPQVLIADDDADVREALADALDAEGFDVRSAADGLEAFHYIQLHPSQVDLVVLDIVMPRMSGYELVARLQQTDALRQIPVVLMTEQPVHWSPAIQHATVQKPFRAASLAACLRKMPRAPRLLNEGRKLLD